MSATTEAVTALLAKYNEALNASSTDAVMPLYAEDGVFMPPYSQSAVGSAAVRKAYDAVFKAITLNVKFTIAEIVELGPGVGFRAHEFSRHDDRPRNRKEERRRQPGVVYLQEGLMTALGKSRGIVFLRPIRRSISLATAAPPIDCTRWRLFQIWNDDFRVSRLVHPRVPG